MYFILFFILFYFSIFMKCTQCFFIFHFPYDIFLFYLFYFILFIFYFILFYFILFYFILSSTPPPYDPV